MSRRIVVLGSCLTATVVACRRIPVDGETVEASGMHESLGGKGLNAAIQAARLGAEVFFVGAVGDDVAGAACEAALREAGVETEFLSRITGERTGHGIILRGAYGANAIAVDTGASRRLSPTMIDAAGDVFDARSVVLAQLEIPLVAAIYGCRMAHRAGATTILNPAPAQDLRNLSLEHIDLLTPNETEAAVCVGATPAPGSSDHPVTVDGLLATGCGSVIITRGSGGSVLHRRDRPPAHVPAFPIDAIDTTGAGDSYNAALAVAIAQGLPLADAMRWASASAAICCTREDTVPAYPDRQTVERFLFADGR